ncbi:MAG: HsdR family type I site-specific deoxyribonuclease [Candidatus Saccharicenans sp.]
MSLFSERRAVQNPFIRYAEEAGWTYLSPEEALRLRRGEDSPFLRTVLVEQLQRLNPDVVDSVTKAEEVVERLRRIRPNIEGNLEAWEYLKGLKTIFVEVERREKNFRLLDPERVEANTFHVTDEFRFAVGSAKIRADVVLLVNGIPVIVVETKAATRIEGIAEAFDQIRRYHEEAPEFLAQTQLFALTHLVEFYYGATWSLSRKTLFNWKDEQSGDYETLVKSFLVPRRVLHVLSECILFPRKDGELSKVVLRPHQMRAVERVLSRAGDRHKHRGLVWHTQGSGKTYTMILAARRLLQDPKFQNPTVLMIVDRNELQQQLFQNLEAVGFGHVHLAQSKLELQELLKSDTRGLIVSMIHKFHNMPANLNTRENIFVLVDEAHRSTGGELGNYLMGALPNAKFIGFTGTPIDKTAYGRGTFKTFGCEDDKGYLDKYSILESIEDGTTVPLYYQLAPNELIVDREAMEKEFWELAELEGVSDVEELDRVLKRSVTLTNMLKNNERIQKIAAFVADHFQTNVRPMGYKAFLVAVDREACCLYKEALDQFLPPSWSAVLISPGHNDPPHMRKYHRSDDDEFQLRLAFRKPGEDPQIFIITEKLLTGYDAPILYAMYLDKPMRDHVLLQAIARVNRPYECAEGQRKTAGLIIDFVGVFENLERALAFDSEDINGVITGLDVLKNRFEELMKKAREEYLPIATGPTEDKRAEAVLEHFRDREVRQQFYSFFREVEEAYEIISPDPFLRPYLDDYEQLIGMYRLLRAAYEPHIPIDRSFLRKTAEIVQRYTQTPEVRPPSEVCEVGSKALRALLGQDKPDTVKVFNLLKEFYRLVEEKGREAPYLIPISERAEEIRHYFEKRLISARQALEELKKLVDELRKAEAERTDRKLSKEAFAVEWWLRTHQVEADCARQIGEQLEGAFVNYPHWAISEAHERELRKDLYKVLIRNLSGAKEIDAGKWVEQILNLLKRAIE